MYVHFLPAISWMTDSYCFLHFRKVSSSCWVLIGAFVLKSWAITLPISKQSQNNKRRGVSRMVDSVYPNHLHLRNIIAYWTFSLQDRLPWCFSFPAATGNKHQPMLPVPKSVMTTEIHFNYNHWKFSPGLLTQPTNSLETQKSVLMKFAQFARSLYLTRVPP